MFPGEALDQSIGIFFSKVIDIDDAQDVLVSLRKVRIRAHLEHDHSISNGVQGSNFVDLKQKKVDEITKMSRVKKRTDPVVDDMADFETPPLKKSKVKADKPGLSLVKAKFGVAGCTRSSVRLLASLKSLPG